MAEPMQSGGAFIGWHVAIANCDGNSLDSGTGYYNASNVFVSTALPSGWTPMVGTGSGGGSGTVLDKYSIALMSSMVLNDTRYPDHGQPGLGTNDRIFHASVPSPFVTGTWRKIEVGLFNIRTPAGAVTSTTAAVTLTLRNMSTATVVGTVTIANGTAGHATNADARATATIASGTFSDGQKLQWHVESAQAINSFGLIGHCWFQYS